MDFTADCVAEVTLRLLRDRCRPGAHTPGSLFGAALAEAAGGELLLDARPGAADTKVPAGAVTAKPQR